MRPAGRDSSPVIAIALLILALAANLSAASEESKNPSNAWQEIGRLDGDHVKAAIDQLGGDWCQGSRIEGAWLSGQALARQASEWARS